MEMKWAELNNDYAFYRLSLADPRAYDNVLLADCCLSMDINAITGLLRTTAVVNLELLPNKFLSYKPACNLKSICCWLAERSEDDWNLWSWIRPNS